MNSPEKISTSAEDSFDSFGWNEFLQNNQPEPESSANQSEAMPASTTFEEATSENIPISSENPAVVPETNTTSNQDVVPTNQIATESGDQSENATSQLTSESTSEQAPQESQIPESDKIPEGSSKTSSFLNSNFFKIARQRAEERLKKAESDYNKKKNATDTARQGYNTNNDLAKAKSADNKKITVEKPKSVEQQKKELEKEKNKVISQIELKTESIDGAINKLNDIKRELELLDKSPETPIKRYSDAEKDAMAKNIGSIWEEINARKDAKEYDRQYRIARREEAKAEKILKKRQNVVDAFKAEQKSQEAKAERKAKRQEFSKKFSTESYKKFLRNNQEGKTRLENEQDELIEKYYDIKDSLTGGSDEAINNKSAAERLEARFRQSQVKDDLKELDRYARQANNEIKKQLSSLEEKADEAKKYKEFFPTFGERIQNLRRNGPVKTALRRIKILYSMSQLGQDPYAATAQFVNQEKPNQPEDKPEQLRPSIANNMDQAQNQAARSNAEQDAA